jgi:Flp pilus assembly protein TadG
MSVLGRAWRDERGDGDVAAMMFILPLIFGVVLLFVFIGRQGTSAEGVTHASHVAAVAASRERSAGEAQAAAQAAAASTLASSGTACVGGPSIAISATEWAPGGVITVTVSCSIETGDLGAIDAPSRQFTQSSRAVIDTYRRYEP